jgi:hypothetical protein
MSIERPQPSEPEHAAYHEAAHAVISLLLRVPFRHISVVASEESRGRMVQGPILEIREERNNPSTRTRLWLERRMMVRLAGPAASSLLGWGEAGGSDWAEARAMARRACANEAEAAAFERWLYERTLNMLREPDTWEAVRRVALALEASQRLGVRTVRRIAGEVLPLRRGARADHSQVEATNTSARG